MSKEKPDETDAPSQESKSDIGDIVLIVALAIIVMICAGIYFFGDEILQAQDHVRENDRILKNF